MRVFLTGATGFIGTALIPELLAAGHQVLGLTRSEAGAEKLRAAGVEPHPGSLENLDSLRAGAAASDAVIHCGFDHDFTDFMAVCNKDRVAIETMGQTLAHSDRLMLITSGTGMGNHLPGQAASEDFFAADHPNPRKMSELAGLTATEAGAKVAVVRLPQVHDPYKAGLITYFIHIARQHGKVAYIGDGSARFPAAHVSDVARLYRLALEKGEANIRYNAVGEEGVPARAYSDVLARGLNLPVESLTPDQAPAYFGWMAGLAGLDMPASNTLTRERLNWHPTGPTLLEDLNQLKWA